MYPASCYSRTSLTNQATSPEQAPQDKSNGRERGILEKSQRARTGSPRKEPTGPNGISSKKPNWRERSLLETSQRARARYPRKKPTGPNGVPSKKANRPERDPLEKSQLSCRAQRGIWGWGRQPQYSRHWLALAPANTPRCHGPSRRRLFCPRAARSARCRPSRSTARGGGRRRSRSPRTLPHRRSTPAGFPGPRSG